MGIAMAYLLIALLAGFMIATAAFYATGRGKFASRLLVLFPVVVCGGLLQNLSRGSRVIGLYAMESDYYFLAFFLVLLALSVFSALYPKKSALFWVAWAITAVVCAVSCTVLIYMVFFWKVFN
ncbi:MAG: hypothetical protein ABSG00_05275 [Terracidiphilus sp.]|jgi:hypothetical protein